MSSWQSVLCGDGETPPKTNKHNGHVVLSCFIKTIQKVQAQIGSNISVHLYPVIQTTQTSHLNVTRHMS